MITGQTRSQDQEKFFHPNGAIYIIKPEELKNNLKTFYINSIPYIMEKKYSTDIDNKIDLNINRILNNVILKKDDLQNKIYFKNLLNEAIKSYAG